MTEAPNRTCVGCGHVHEYEMPVYCCAVCRTWGQDFYELRPLSWWSRLLNRISMWGPWDVT